MMSYNTSLLRRLLVLLLGVGLCAIGSEAHAISGNPSVDFLIGPRNSVLNNTFELRGSKKIPRCSETIDMRRMADYEMIELKKPSVAKCAWMFKVPAYSRLSMEIYSFDLMESAGFKCPIEYLATFDLEKADKGNSYDLTLCDHIDKQTLEIPRANTFVESTTVIKYSRKKDADYPENTFRIGVYKVNYFDKTPTPQDTKAGCGVVLENRIIGGGNVLPTNQIPWQVGLVKSGDLTAIKCGATVVSPLHLITAAHCFDEGVGKKDLMVVYGAYDLSKHTGQKYRKIGCVKVHEDYRPESHLADIALLTLRKPLEFGALVNMACLPKGVVQLTESYEGRVATISGWGSTDHYMGSKPSVLRMVKVHVSRNEDCVSTHLPKVMCAMPPRSMDGRGVCDGDSGGPLTVIVEGRAMLVGVNQATRYCKNSMEEPDTFTRVTAFSDWITKNMATRCT